MNFHFTLTHVIPLNYSATYRSRSPCVQFCGFVLIASNNNNVWMYCISTVCSNTWCPTCFCSHRIVYIVDRIRQTLSMNGQLSKVSGIVIAKLICIPKNAPEYARMSTRREISKNRFQISRPRRKILKTARVVSKNRMQKRWFLWCCAQADTEIIVTSFIGWIFCCLWKASIFDWIDIYYGYWHKYSSNLLGSMLNDSIILFDHGDENIFDQFWIADSFQYHHYKFYYDCGYRTNQRRRRTRIKMTTRKSRQTTRHSDDCCHDSNNESAMLSKSHPVRLNEKTIK